MPLYCTVLSQGLHVRLLVYTLFYLSGATQAGQLHEPIALALACKLEGHWKNLSLLNTFHALRFFHVHHIKLSRRARLELCDNVAAVLQPARLTQLRPQELLALLCTC